MKDQPFAIEQDADHVVERTARLLAAYQEQLSQQRAEMLQLRERYQSDLDQVRVVLQELSYAAAGLPKAALGGREWSGESARLEQLEASIQRQMQALSNALTNTDRILELLQRMSDVSGPAPLPEGGESGHTEGVLRGQEAERVRLAREIHDGPAQVLANSIMGLEFCERLLERRPTALPSELNRLKSSLAEGLEDVRRFIFDLRPTSLEHEGLVATLQRYTATYAERFDVVVGLTADQVDTVLTPEQRFAAFRIIQESMQNIRKHAAAGEIRVGLQRDDDRVLVSVRDDGQGFSLDVDHLRDGHYGLIGMSERAASVGGTVIVFSEPGFGTEVLLCLPVAMQVTGH